MARTISGLRTCCDEDPLTFIQFPGSSVEEALQPLDPLCPEPDCYVFETRTCSTRMPLRIRDCKMLVSSNYTQLHNITHAHITMTHELLLKSVPAILKAFAKKRAFPAWSCQSTPSVMEFNPICQTTPTQGSLDQKGASQAAALVTSATTHWVRSKARFRSASVRARDEILWPNCPKCLQPTLPNPHMFVLHVLPLIRWKSTDSMDGQVCLDFD